MAKHNLKAGDLVRAPARSDVNACGCGFKPGQVVEVVEVDGHHVTLRGGHRGRSDLLQWVSCPYLKRAKQAMRKRDQYASRRG